MLDYPTLTPENKTRDLIDVFGGYNHNPRIQDNEFYDMQNMTSSSYPLLATRDKRGEVPAELCGGAGNSADYVRGMIYRSALYYVVYKYNPSLQTVTVPFALRKYADGDDIEIKAFSSGYMNNHNKRDLIMMGAYMIILPDKLYVNVEDPTDYGSIEAEITTEDGETVSVQPCLADGKVIDIKYVGSTAPKDYYDGYVWVDTSEDTAQVKYYDEENNIWAPVISQYIRFTAENTDISADFNEGDGIKISGVPEELTEEAIDFNGVSVLRLKPDDTSIVVSGHFKNTIQVFDVITQLSKTKVKVFCARTVDTNDYNGKTFIVGDRRIACIGSTSADEYKNYIDRDMHVSSAQADYFTTISKKQTASPNALWKKIKVKVDTSAGESIWDSVGAEEDLYVRVGNKDTSSRNVYLYHHSTGTAPAQGASVEAADEISLKYAGDGSDPLVISSGGTSTWVIPAGSKIYPIKLGDSKGLFETKLTFAQTVDVHDRICLDPGYKIDCDDQLTFSRLMPEMDFIIEAKNRLWGCRYGENNDGEVVNEIYACKLGDFKNWQVYEGVSTDSYAASCGTDGAWTGAINYLGYPVFFKENYIHTVYGSYPAQYQINSIEARGVQAGCSDSLAMVNEVLFYKSPNGICAYTGSLPSQISAALGDMRYHDAIACAFNGKYYVCMKDSANAAHFFVYDVSRNLWHKEDNLYVGQFCPVADDIYYLSSNGLLKSLFGSGGLDSTAIQWFVETGIIGLSAPDHKYVSRVNIRLSIDEPQPSNFHVVNAYIQYDSSDSWESLYTGIHGGRADGQMLQPYTLRIKPKRCDHFRLKLSGNGRVKIYSISKTIEQGSDVNYNNGRVK